MIGIIGLALNELLHRPEFGDGLALGIVFGVSGLVVGVIWQGAWHRPAPIAGLVVVLSFVLAANGSASIPSNVKWGLVMLAAAGAAADLVAKLWPPLVVLGAGFALPGASLLTTNTELPSPHWIHTLVIVTVTVGGTLVADFDRRHRDRGWAPMMFAVSVVGVYFTVPDTERAMVLLGAALPIVLLGWPFPLASLGGAGSYSCVGALAWVSAFDGRGRLSSIVGGMACLGLLLAEPVAHIIRENAPGIIDTLPRGPMAAIVIGCGQLVLVFVASRVVGMWSDARQALLLAVLELGAAAAFLAFVSAGDREDAPDDG